MRRPELVREQFLAECRTRQVEPPTSGQVDRIVGGALSRAAETVAGRVAGRIAAATVPRLLALVAAVEPDVDAVDDAVVEVEEDPSLLRWIKSSPRSAT